MNDDLHFNIFYYYRGPEKGNNLPLENNITRALLIVLQHSKLALKSFTELLKIRVTELNDLKSNLQSGHKGSFDATLEDANLIIGIESKKESGEIKPQQIRRHLKALKSSYGKNKNKILLVISPDSDNNPVVMKQKRHSPMFRHLNWKSICDAFKNLLEPKDDAQFLINEFTDFIERGLLKMDKAGVIHRFRFSKGGFDSVEDGDKFLKSIFDGKRNYYNLRNKGFPRAIENENKYFFIFDAVKEAIIGARRVLKVNDTGKGHYKYKVIFKDKPIKFVPPISVKELKKINDETIQREFFKNKRKQSYRTINQTAVDEILKVRN